MDIENRVIDGIYIRHFIRVRIKINIKNPLSIGCSKNLPKVWMTVKYEKLQDLCFNCGIIGYEQRSCKVPKEMSLVDKNSLRYGMKLSVSPAKELNDIKEERARWKLRAQEQESRNNSPPREE